MNKNKPTLISILIGGFCSFLAFSSFGQVTVQLGDEIYDVTVEDLIPSPGTYSLITSQPEYGNPDLASLIAAEVGTQLGLPNYTGYGPSPEMAGPLFVYADSINPDDPNSLGSFHGSQVFPEYGPGVYEGVSIAGYDVEDVGILTFSAIPELSSTLPLAGLSFLSLLVLRRYLRPQSAA